MKELLATLHAQLATITTLTKIIRRERDAIAGGNLELLQHCQQEKEAFQRQLWRLEESRHFSAQGKSLREIAVAPGAPAEDLLALRQNLQLALRELKLENETNSLFLKHQLAYLNCFREAARKELTTNRYTKTGKITIRQSLPDSMVSVLA